MSGPINSRGLAACRCFYQRNVIPVIQQIGSPLGSADDFSVDRKGYPFFKVVKLLQQCINAERGLHYHRLIIYIDLHG